eukprot:NODE_11252_length_463_cov_57.447059_g10597_i0.p1 GENE.NODE_11252_length_463_cov_57.447059_g10597_i0~~NODE_11252_length_463_cov_57.447059_g10597_i0.p1  ORF type:complete len:109 (+),score=14.77 NODE_11252_length_463_cov_57.447059_g10597_i0:58-384(+)
MRFSNVKLSSPLVPLYNDTRQLIITTRVEQAQRNKQGSFGLRYAKYLPTEWATKLFITPVKYVPALLGFGILLGGWGYEFATNISVMGAEKPPIDWNNDRLGYLVKKH